MASAGPFVAGGASGKVAAPAQEKHVRVPCMCCAPWPSSCAARCSTHACNAQAVPPPTRPPACVPARLPQWECSDYTFDPYTLAVAPALLSDAGKSTSSKAEETAVGGKAGSLDAPQQPVKRRPGRQRRTSVLCQVRRVQGLGVQGPRVQGRSVQLLVWIPCMHAAWAPSPGRTPTMRAGPSPNVPPAQVAGCCEELIDAKKYYRRYRICQLHCNM